MKKKTKKVPATGSWRSFVKRFKKIPKTFQMAILDEYEEARKEKRPLDVDKMWKLLILGGNRKLMFDLLNADEKNLGSVQERAEKLINRQIFKA